MVIIQVLATIATPFKSLLTNLKQLILSELSNFYLSVYSYSEKLDTVGCTLKPADIQRLCKAKMIDSQLSEKCHAYNHF